MEKVCIIVGTNRDDSVSAQVAEYYQEKFEKQKVSSSIIDLKNLPPDFIFSALYENNGKNVAFNLFVDTLSQYPKYLFIVPEYNGSFPGVLKAFIDGLPYPNSFRNKKCAMVGLSNGMQGSGLAMSHLTDIFHYLGMNVLAQKVKLAFIGKHFDGKEIRNSLYEQLIDDQISKLLTF